ncbi:RagB/SusD family nutrient uptake outer membrane protein [Chitinophaga horti]|uniref:RagB/SusD family nutrient uptake outer membrane protein n=1 Tax=Chitinophaga horti TaxID=2920382 RepID=A0ABY6J5B9_9BACT|nr:RagB/SusD family nutrient uptake outer membrane protein [Chitinophaga horti]UYQ94878.1 RagB/SusD family nutrient uptake outer membrane protein [Chitinophaga horti]
MNQKFAPYILVLLLATSLSAGCSKLLEEKNPGGLTAEGVFSSPEGFETLVNAAYSYNRWWYGKEDAYNISEMGTDLWTSGTGDKYTDITSYYNLQSYNTAVTSLWKQLYAAINLINTGINRIDQVGLADAIKTRRLAELRFLRAFYYWHVVETWGDVHFSTNETTTAVTTANRTPVDTFYAHIFADLEFAAANLPPTTTEYGRATKPVAEAFLARMNLTRGRNQQAFDLASKVIKDYGFQLQPKYADLWSMTNIQNKEVIWAVNYFKNLAFNDRTDAVLYPTGHPRGAHNGHLMFIMKYDDLPGMTRDVANGRPFNRYMPTLYALRLFDETKDSRYNATFKQAWLCNTLGTAPAGMKIGDTAVFCTKYEIPAEIEATRKYRVYDLSKMYKANGGGLDRLHYPSLQKFDDPTRAAANEEQSPRDGIVMRLAEMYLIAAEAQLKLNNTTIAAEYINVIRKRAAVPGQEAAMEILPAQVTLDFILDERARELMGEQLRWFDLKRTGKLSERLQLANPDAAANFAEFHLVRPIPKDQVDAVTNKNEFKQHTGYN